MMNLEKRAHAALNKLAKWRSVFAGWQMGSAHIENETCRAIRDHREVTMLMRVELNALVQVLVAKGVFTSDDLFAQLRIEAELLDAAYEKKFPGFKTIPDGVVIYNSTLAADTTRNWKP